MSRIMRLWRRMRPPQEPSCCYGGPLLEACRDCGRARPRRGPTAGEPGNVQHLRNGGAGG